MWWWLKMRESFGEPVQLYARIPDGDIVPVPDYRRYAEVLGDPTRPLPIVEPGTDPGRPALLRWGRRVAR